MFQVFLILYSRQLIKKNNNNNNKTSIFENNAAQNFMDSFHNIFA